LVPLDTVLTTLLISVMSVAAVLVPARAAARIEPAEALRSVG
jgi:ABC-type lipoprotein release transport system permease subunit